MLKTVCYKAIGKSLIISYCISLSGSFIDQVDDNELIQYYIYIFIVDNLEFESENSHSILMGKSLLDGVIVDVSVNQMQLKRVPGRTQHKLKCRYS